MVCIDVHCVAIPLEIIEDGKCLCTPSVPGKAQRFASLNPGDIRRDAAGQPVLHQGFFGPARKFQRRCIIRASNQGARVKFQGILGAGNRLLELAAKEPENRPDEREWGEQRIAGLRLLQIRRTTLKRT